MSRLHFYSSSDIPGTIFPAFTNMVRDGQEVFEIPYDTSKYSNIQPFGSIQPSRHKIDYRSDVRKSEDLAGKSPQTMRVNLKTFRSHPHIVGCSSESMVGGTTETSLTNHPVL